MQQPAHILSTTLYVSYGQQPFRMVPVRKGADRKPHLVISVPFASVASHLTPHASARCPEDQDLFPRHVSMRNWSTFSADVSDTRQILEVALKSFVFQPLG